MVRDHLSDFCFSIPLFVSQSPSPCLMRGTGISKQSCLEMTFPTHSTLAFTEVFFFFFFCSKFVNESTHPFAWHWPSPRKKAAPDALGLGCPSEGGVEFSPPDIKKTYLLGDIKQPHPHSGSLGRASLETPFPYARHTGFLVHGSPKNSLQQPVRLTSMHGEHGNDKFTVL